MHKDLENNTRHGQPSTAQNSETFVKVHKLGARDYWMPLKLMQDQLHIKEETIHYILHKDFGKRRIYLKFVLESHRRAQGEESQFAKTTSRISQLHHYSRWVFGFSVKFQNKITRYGTENKTIKAQNFWLQKPRIKTMFIICTEKQCVTYRESVSGGKTKNSKF